MRPGQQLSTYNFPPTATLVAYVAIKPSYPSEAPIFALSLSNPLQSAAPRPPGSPRLQGETLDTSEWVRDFERELNLNWSDQLALGSPGRAGLLTAQLHRLLVLMDVVLEAATEAEKGFAKSQVFFSCLRGRVRRLPLQYCSKSQVALVCPRLPLMVLSGISSPSGVPAEMKCWKCGGGRIFGTAHLHFKCLLVFSPICSFEPYDIVQ
jgi:hypothetical protein